MVNWWPIGRLMSGQVPDVPLLQVSQLDPPSIVAWYAVMAPPVLDGGEYATRSCPLTPPVLTDVMVGAPGALVESARAGPAASSTPEAVKAEAVMTAAQDLISDLTTLG